MQILPQHPHLAMLHTALSAELADVQAEHERLLRLPYSDRVAAGVSWPVLQLHSVDDPGWSSWIQVGLRTVGRGVLHDGITPGDLVMVAPVSSPDQGISGRCVFAEGDFAEVRLMDLDALPGWLEGGHVAVTRAIDPSTVRRYQTALLRADGHDSALCAALLASSAELAEAEAEDSSASVALSGLNDAQRHAGHHVLSSPSLSLVHGPPGTGKTSLMVRLLQALVSGGEKPWALADSNAAVDHLSARADAAGLSVLRLGAPYRIGASVRHLTFEAHAARSPLSSALKVLESELSRLPPRERRPLYRERRALLAQIRAQVIGDCDLIASTLGTMSREAPSLPPGTVALVDEATQAVEPAIWSIVPWVSRLVLLGDPHQLGPVVHSPGNPLHLSLLSRLLDAGHTAPMLEEQYRMSASLCALVSDVYGPSYRPHPSVASHRLSDLPGVSATPLTSAPMLWVDTAGGGLEEARDPVTMSLYNDGEVGLVADLVDRLLRAGVRPSDIGVIAPYSAQVARLRGQLPDVEVATVNAFQGREKEAIVCSFVRSSDGGELGFVSDPRRLVVSLTRARRFLGCVGDSATLSSSSMFSSVMSAWQRGMPSSWQSVWEPPWDAALSS